MKIVSLKTDGFKNLKNIDICFDGELNIFCGENAQGKTNLIENIWLCTGLKSFRGTKDKDFICLNKETSFTELVFEDSFREQKINFNLSRQNLKDKAVYLNGVKLKSPSKLFGALQCVIFTPEDLELSKGSPDNRRRFCDLSVSMIKKSYLGVINKYSDIIDQRNRLLKNIAMGVSSRNELFVWDEQLAKLGAYISVLRYAYVKKLGVIAGELYKELSNGKEELTLSYNSTVFESLDGREDYAGEMKEEYLSRLNDSVEEDIRAGFTLKGVHRDDLVTYINGLSSREYGSQGQNRSVALVLKLAQAYILKDELDDSPVILLDDVLSELDLSRQDFVLSKIKDMQVFITCCDMNEALMAGKKSRFLIKNGEAEKI